MLFLFTWSYSCGCFVSCESFLPYMYTLKVYIRLVSCTFNKLANKYHMLVVYLYLAPENNVTQSLVRN